MARFPLFPVVDFMIKFSIFTRVFYVKILQNFIRRFMEMHLINVAQMM